jgi:hypothetical protein
VYVYTYTPIYTYIHIYIQHIYIYIYVYICTHLYIYTHTFINTHLFIYMYMHTCTYVYMHTYTNIYTSKQTVSEGAPQRQVICQRSLTGRPSARSYVSVRTHTSKPTVSETQREHICFRKQMYKKQRGGETDYGSDTT